MVNKADSHEFRFYHNVQRLRDSRALARGRIRAQAIVDLELIQQSASADVAR
jgi:hypothetical protein